MESQTVNIAYHYTSVDTFLKMLDGIKYDHFLFHGSYILSMNDPIEFKYGFNQVHRLLNSIENELLIQQDDRLSIIWNTDDVREEQIDMLSKTFQLPFVVCFSNHKDYLPQWITYGDNGKGISIGFDIQDYYRIYKTKNNYKVFDFTNFKEHELHAIKVEYKSISNRHQFRYFLRLFCNNYKETVQKIKNEQERIKYQLDCLHTIAFFLSALIKHKAYSYESETRILFPCSRINDVLFKTNAKGQLVPYIKMGVETKRLKKIVVGPLCDFESTKFVIETKLRQLNIDNVKILKSNIPFR